MKNLLKEKYDTVEGLRGARLYKFLAGIFLFFLVFGLLAGYIFAELTGPSNDSSPDNGSEIVPVDVESSFEGTVTYIDPQFHSYKDYLHEDISYELTDSKGNTIILLSAGDEKLVVSEGHYVKVFGDMSKTEDGEKDVLLVDRVVIKNVSN